MLRVLNFTVFIGMLGFQTACKSPDTTAVAQPVDTRMDIDSIAPVLPTDTVYKVSYRMYYLNDSLRKRFSKDFTRKQLTTIGFLNRIEVGRLTRLDSVIVPDSFMTDLNAYSPFPKALPMVDSLRKLLLISYRIQAFGFYMHGKLQRWGPVSMGKKSTPTPVGFFHTNWKSKLQISTDNPEWLLPWYFNLVNSTGASMHQYELPGYPASHACIRLREEDALWIYQNADQWRLNKTGIQIRSHGTPVIIYGAYAFGKPRPWYALAQDADANLQQADTLNALIQPYWKVMLREQAVRDSISQKGH